MQDAELVSGASAPNSMTAAEGITILVMNAFTAMVFAVGVAFLLKLLFSRVPKARIVIDLLPWRTGVALVLLWATPNSWLLSRAEPINVLLHVVMDAGGMEALSWISNAIGISVFSFALVCVGLIHHWFPKTLLQNGVGLLRSGAMLAAVAVFFQQMLAAVGLGGALMKGYYVLSREDVSSAWQSIVLTLLTIDLLLGALQCATAVWAHRRLTSAP